MISEWLEKAISKNEVIRNDVYGFRVIVMCDPSKQQEIANEIKKLGIRVIDSSVPGMILVDVPYPQYLDNLDKIHGVKYITYDRKFYPLARGIDEVIKSIIIKTDPMLKNLKKNTIESLGYGLNLSDIPPILKTLVYNILSIDNILAHPHLIAKLLSSIKENAEVITKVDWEIVTNTKKLMGVPDYLTVDKITTCVIDTGVRYGPGIGDMVCYVMTDIPDLPIDDMGHGSWCHACAFGLPSRSPYGDFIPVSIAKKTFHIKIFTAFGGCSSFTVTKAMFNAAYKHGANVISMSLGGPLIDPVDKTPECSIAKGIALSTNTLLVCAAGNDGKEWSINSPGASPYVVTIAAHGWKDPDKVASYSSRGPQGMYYQTHKDEFEDLINKYGERALKPTVAAIGGDVDGFIASACSLWYDGMMDYAPNGWDLMIGTSMATPHAAGMFGVLYDVGKIKNVDTALNLIYSRLGKYKDENSGSGLLDFRKLVE